MKSKKLSLQICPVVRGFKVALVTGKELTMWKKIKLEKSIML